MSRIRPAQRDAYSQEVVDDPLPTLHDVPVDDGYGGTRPNPVYNGLPWLWLVVDPATGEIVRVEGKLAHEVTPEEHREKAMEIAKRQRRPGMPRRKRPRKKSVVRGQAKRVR